jgi:GntR family transcriptional repressor for pyruvate dehydrogenase complex
LSIHKDIPQFDDDDSGDLHISQLIRTPLYQQVSNSIQKWIFSGVLKPNDQLPSEKELCERFGVSRTVIREATKALSARGLVIIEAGRGVFVKHLTIEDLTNSFNQLLHFSNNDLNDLLDVRELLECRIVELAAQRVSEEDLFQMEKALKVLDNEEDIHSYLEGDLAFHSSLALAAKSSLFAGLINSIVAFLFDVRLQGFLVGGSKRGRVDHWNIYAAVKNKDPIMAREAMRIHLNHVREDIEKEGVFRPLQNHDINNLNYQDTKSS